MFFWSWDILIDTMLLIIQKYDHPLIQIHLKEVNYYQGIGKYHRVIRRKDLAVMLNLVCDQFNLPAGRLIPKRLS